MDGAALMRLEFRSAKTVRRTVCLSGTTCQAWDWSAHISWRSIPCQPLAPVSSPRLAPMTIPLPCQLWYDAGMRRPFHADKWKISGRHTPALRGWVAKILRDGLSAFVKLRCCFQRVQFHGYWLNWIGQKNQAIFLSNEKPSNDAGCGGFLFLIFRQFRE